MCSKMVVVGTTILKIGFGLPGYIYIQLDVLMYFFVDKV